MKKIFILMLPLIFSGWVQAAPTSVATIGLENFSWYEYEPGSGRELLNEKGLRTFVGFRSQRQLKTTVQESIGRLYFGTVDYDGETLTGIPVTTDTAYIGYNIEVNFSSGILGGSDPWDSRFGIGLDYWQRDLKDTTSGGSPVYGYTEQYTIIYARLGAGYKIRNWDVRLGMKLPFYTREQVSLINGLVLKPKGTISLYSSVDYAYNNGRSISMYYDTYRFNQSDPSMGYLQPESHQDTMGINFNFAM